MREDRVHNLHLQVCGVLECLEWMCTFVFWCLMFINVWSGIAGSDGRSVVCGRRPRKNLVASKSVSEIVELRFCCTIQSADLQTRQSHTSWCLLIRSIKQHYNELWKKKLSQIRPLNNCTTTTNKLWNLSLTDSKICMHCLLACFRSTWPPPDYILLYISVSRPNLDKYTCVIEQLHCY